MWTSSAGRAVAVTPDNDNDIGVTSGIYVGGAGNLAVHMADGTIVTFTAITTGEIHNLAVSRVLSTGTTATLIIALYAH